MHSVCPVPDCRVAVRGASRVCGVALLVCGVAVWTSAQCQCAVVVCGVSGAAPTAVQFPARVCLCRVRAAARCARWLGLSVCRPVSEPCLFC